MKRKYHSNRKRHKSNFIFIFIALMCLTGILWLLMELNKTITQSVIELSHIHSKQTASEIIDKAVSQSIKELDVTSSDFFINSMNSSTAISVNTLLINQFCTSVSENLSQDLNRLSDEEIGVPFGMASGIDLFANHGPEIHYSLRPAGTADVDYDTSFVSVGINQINFKIWIHVTIDIKVIYPLYHETISLSRKVMLVDTVLDGTVPDHYFQISESHFVPMSFSKRFCEKY